MNSIRAGQTKPPFGVSHTVPPAKAPDAYEHFDNRDEGWTAVVLKPRPSQIHNCGGTSTLLIDARLTDRAALDAVAGVYVFLNAKEEEWTRGTVLADKERSL